MAMRNDLEEASDPRTRGANSRCEARCRLVVATTFTLSYLLGPEERELLTSCPR